MPVDVADKVKPSAPEPVITLTVVPVVISVPETVCPTSIEFKLPSASTDIVSVPSVSPF